MAKKSGIEIIEEDRTKEPVNTLDKACPVCGAPGGGKSCDECGWSVEELEPDFGGSSRDPVSTILHARLSYTEMKKSVADIKKKMDSLMENNARFSDLVESMEAEMKRMREAAGKKFVYRYERGGWGEVGGLDMSKMRLRSRGLTVRDINKQLSEIMRMLKKYKK